MNAHYFYHMETSCGECSVAQDYLESQPSYSADNQLVNTEAISASHEAMPTTLFTWKPVVECYVAQDYLESQPRYSANNQLVNTEAISASHEAMPTTLFTWKPTVSAM